MFTCNMGKMADKQLVEFAYCFICFRGKNKELLRTWSRWDVLELQLSSGTAFPERTPPRPGTSGKLPGFRRWKLDPTWQQPRWSGSQTAAATQQAAENINTRSVAFLEELDNNSYISSTALPWSYQGQRAVSRSAAHSARHRPPWCCPCSSQPGPDRAGWLVRALQPTDLPR